MNTDKIIVFPKTPGIPLITPINNKKSEMSRQTNRTFLSLDNSIFISFSAWRGCFYEDDEGCGYERDEEEYQEELEKDHVLSDDTSEP
jgi:hypothetical protein